MGHDAAEYGLIGSGLGTDIGISILKLQLLVMKVVAEAPESAAPVFGAIFVVECVVLDLLANLI
jgi:hypothetical protein